MTTEQSSFGRRGACAPGARRPLPETSALKALCGKQISPVDRHTLLKAADDAAQALRLSTTARAILGCLASTYGAQDLSQGLMVWPSNAYLEAKTSVPERSIRRAILLLRREGLLLCHDSPNGKRFALKRTGANTIEKVYGFDLRPLILRAAEFQAELASRFAHEQLLRSLRRDLNAARRELFAILTALARAVPAGTIEPLEATWRETAPPRSKQTPPEHLEALLVRAEAGRERAEQIHYDATRTQTTTANGGHFGRHIEPNKEASIENCKEHQRGANAPQLHLEAASGGSWAVRETAGTDAVRYDERSGPAETESWTHDHASLSEASARQLADHHLWSEACPELLSYGKVTQIADVIQTGLTMSQMLQLSLHAREKWRRQLGRERFALVAAFVYQLVADDVQRPTQQIRQPGGLFCHIAQDVLNSRNLANDLMALRRKRMRH